MRKAISLTVFVTLLLLVLFIKTTQAQDAEKHVRKEMPYNSGLQ